jgi:predicted PurR-regulated permease PerM
LHPGLVFAGLIGALMLSGFLGALVVVPLLATAKVVGRYVHRKLLGLPPWVDEAEESADGATEMEVQEEEPAYPV